MILAVASMVAVPSFRGDCPRKGGGKIVRAVIVLALAVACSGSASPRVVSEDAGDLSGARRGRQGASDVRQADVVRALPDVLALVPDVVQGGDSATAAADARSSDLIAVSDVRVADVMPVVDTVLAADARSVDAVADWGRVDDAGQLHCRQPPSNPVKCAAYEISDGSRWIRCWLDMGGTIKASCRWGVEGQVNYDWYVLACADCAVLENWGGK